MKTKTIILAIFMLQSLFCYSDEDKRRYELRTWHWGDERNMCVFDTYTGNVYLFDPKKQSEMKNLEDINKTRKEQGLEERVIIPFWAIIPSPESEDFRYMFGSNDVPLTSEETKKITDKE